MFVLYNENLNRYFKHPRVGGVWWSHDAAEAEKMLENIKSAVVESGFPEVVNGLRVVEFSETIEEYHEDQKCPGV
jgi:hypothetical protein